MLRGASAAERWVGLAVGLALAAFAGSALRNGRLSLDAQELAWLRLGPWCGRQCVPLRRIRRFGEGYEQNRGRRQRTVLLELGDGTRRSIKLAVYAGQRRFLEELGARLGQGPAPTRTTFLGLQFEDDA